MGEDAEPSPLQESKENTASQTGGEKRKGCLLMIGRYV